jgi:opacity protein-like surface antigen
MTDMRFTALLAALFALCLGSALAADATSDASASGVVQVWATPNQGDTPYGKIVVTGAIGDYGRSTNTDKSGKIDPDGDYIRVTLKHGSFIVDTSAIEARYAHLKPQLDSATCSAIFAISAVPVGVSHGTGAYAGISGTGKLSYVFAGLAPRYGTGPKKGQCNLSNNTQPTASYSSVTGTLDVQLP